MRLVRWSRVLPYVQVAVGLSVLAWAILFVGSSEVLGVLASADLRWVAIATVLWAAVGLLMSGRLVLLLGGIGHAISLWRIVPGNWAGLLLSDFTPGRMGYFAVIHFLHREHVPLKTSLAVVGSIQVVEFLIKAAATVAFLVFLRATLPLPSSIEILVALGAVALSGATVVGSLLLFGGRTATLKRILRRVPYGKGITSRFTGMSRDARSLVPHLGAALLISLVGVVVVGAQWWFVAQALSLELPLPVFFLLAPVGTALAFVPVTIAGIGIQEGGVGILLVLFGVPPALALAFPLLVRITTIVADLPGALVLLRAPEVGVPGDAAGD